MIEVLLALIVLSLASVAVIGAFSTTIAASAEHRTLATFNTVLRSATEQAVSSIEGNTDTSFSPCATASYYQPGGLGAVNFSGISPTGTNYSAEVTGVSYWNGTTFSTSGCVVQNNAPQQITVTVTDNNNGRSYTNSFVVDDSVATPLLPLCVEPNCTPASIIFGVEPAGASAGEPFTTQPVVWAVTSANTIARHDASTVNLTITAGTGATGATILDTCQGTETSGVTTFTNCGINLGSANQYTLTATDPSLGYTAVSTSFYNYTQLSAPAITSATPSSTTPGGVTVNFTAPANAPGGQTYTGEICTDPGMTIACVNSTPPFTSGSTIAGTVGSSYYVQVTAPSSAGYQGSTSAIYGPTSATYPQMGAPGTPVLAYGSTAGSLQVTSFAPSTPAVGGQTYTVTYCTSPTSGCNTTTMTPSGGTISNLNYTQGAAGSTYYVTVTANAVTGYTQSIPSGQSNHADTSQVDAPSNLRANGSGSGLDVTFTSSGSGVASDTLVYCTNSYTSGCTGPIAATPSGTQINGLTNHHPYYVTVTAVGSTGYLSDTAEVQGTAS